MVKPPLRTKFIGFKVIDPFGLDGAYLNDAGNGVESVDQNSNSRAPGTYTIGKAAEPFPGVS